MGLTSTEYSQYIIFGVFQYVCRVSKYTTSSFLFIPLVNATILNLGGLTISPSSSVHFLIRPPYIVIFSLAQYFVSIVLQKT